mgnify:CR=1 FL=1
MHHCQVQVAEFVRAVERRCHEDDMTDTKTIRDVIDLFINNSDGFGIKVDNYLDQDYEKLNKTTKMLKNNGWSIEEIIG